MKIKALTKISTGDWKMELGQLTCLDNGRQPVPGGSNMDTRKQTETGSLEVPCNIMGH